MGRPLRVLVVEDDADLAEFARVVLSRRGDLDLTLIADGHQALEHVRRHDLDLLVTDIQLPGVTGLDIAAAARERDPALPIAVMTAHASLDYALTALRSQVDEFLVKPVKAQTWRTTVDKLVELGRTRRAAALGGVVLAIGAHPDDVEIGVGALLAAHRDGGDKVVILTMSRGARGGDEDRRQHESLASAELIGARLFLEDQPDTAIPPAEPTVTIIERVVAEIDPTVVYTHSSHDRHQDHGAVHQASMVATRSVPTVACYQSPSATVDFRPNRFVPVDGFLETKLAQLACFSTQAGIRAYLEPDFVLATARYWSRFGGARHCEPLEVIRDTRGLIGGGRDAAASMTTDDAWTVAS